MPVALRSDLRPGDLDVIVRLHGAIYAAEHGFDRSFEGYVAEPLRAFAERALSKERIWIAEAQGRIVGCVAIVDASGETAQLRWFLVDPSSRGRGLGRSLLEHAVDFARQAGYRAIVLWTVSALAAAAALYRAAGFIRVEERPGRHWGVDVIEERYELRVADNAGILPIPEDS